MIPPQRAEISEDALINGEIVITSYFDTDGRLKYATAVTDDMNLAQAIGLCHLAAVTIRETYTANEPYPPDGYDEDDDEDDEEDDEE